MHRFFSGWLVEEGGLSLEELWPVWMSGGPGGCDYATHLLSWWARKFTSDKYGTATTHWSKLQERIARGVGAPCPLILIGLPPNIIDMSC